MGKTESISSKIRNKKRVPTPNALIQYSIRKFSQNSEERERNKKDTNRKEVQITSVCG
jgi:hypothetical protein